MNTPNDDESCAILADALKRGDRFCHTKFGDFPLQMMLGAATYERSSDGEPVLPAEHWYWIWRTFLAAAHQQNLYMGDWNTCSDTQNLEAEWEVMIAGEVFELVSYEALLMHRLTPALLDFYATLAKLSARKVMLTSAFNSLAAEMLGASLLLLPDPGAGLRGDILAKQQAAIIRDANPLPDLLILAAGGVGLAVQAHLLEWRVPITQISIGSGLDPLFRGRTRSGQVHADAAREYFRSLL